MKTLQIQTEQTLNMDFSAASKMSDAIAASLLGEQTTCLSWYDGLRDHECPAHASECHDACEIPGYLDYARTRGAQLKVDIDKGTFVFCYRTVEEFA